MYRLVGDIILDAGNPLALALDSGGFTLDLMILAIAFLVEGGRPPPPPPPPPAPRTVNVVNIYVGVASALNFLSGTLALTSLVPQGTGAIVSIIAAIPLGAAVATILRRGAQPTPTSFP